MESLVGLVGSILMILVLSVPLGIVYRHRSWIKHYITDAQFANDWDGDPIKKAERGVIKAEWKLEDAKDFLQWKRDKVAYTKSLDDEKSGE